MSASPTSDAAVASSTALAKRDSTGVEELSTTTLRDGSVETLVKTTRPIINPGCVDVSFSASFLFLLFSLED